MLLTVSAVHLYQYFTERLRPQAPFPGVKPNPLVEQPAGAPAHTTEHTASAVQPTDTAVFVSKSILMK